MKKESKKPDDRICSFCGKNADDVRKLIAGPCVFICDECVILCTGIVSGSDPLIRLEILKGLKQDKLWRNEMKTLDAPNDFWDLLDESHIFEKMADSVLTSDSNWSDALYERAYNLTKKSRVASSKAWKVLFESHPELEGKQISASHGMRKIHVQEF